MKMVSDKGLKLKLVTQAVMLALVCLADANAEEVAQEVPTEQPSDVPLNLDKIVVTGTANKISKMKSSISVSTMNAEQVQNTGATNAAEVLRSIPGVRSESSGGDSNANMTVRGLPISAGGARYVQLQEDGLPILQFGDIAFSTPDTFFRLDQGLGRLEVVRGASASTLATNSPGGIINFINQTGEQKGGKVGLSAGLNYDQWRTDFSYGGPITDDVRGFVSGYYRRGEGFRDSGETLEEGGQIKGNITKQFDNGYIRLNFKHLDDESPTNLPVPTTTDGRGNIVKVPGIDPRDYSPYGKKWSKDVVLTGSNGLKSTDVNDGMSVKTDSVGAEFSFNFNGFEISDKFRVADNRGRFIGIFPSSSLKADGSYDAVIFNS